MELYEQILYHLLEDKNAKVEVTFPGVKFSAQELVESAAYCALSQIQRILKDNTLNDEECYYKIEAIVSEFERIGSGCGNRHDFG